MCVTTTAPSNTCFPVPTSNIVARLKINLKSIGFMLNVDITLYYLYASSKKYFVFSIGRFLNIRPVMAIAAKFWMEEHCL